MDVKQVLVWRKDLNVRKGKIGAQIAHASSLGLLALFTKENITDEDGNEYIRRTVQYGEDSILHQWLEGNYTKIVLGCEDELELFKLHEKAKSLGLPTVMILDNGLTEFNGVQTNTCISIGPWDSEQINQVTGHLKPL